jgi:transcriptional regulator with XRE-family HTH domain
VGTLAAENLLQGIMAGKFRNRAYDALVEALKARREALKLSQIEVCKRLPKWLSFNHTKLNRVEHKTRGLSFVEARELANVLSITLKDLDGKALDSEAARSHPIPRGRAKRPPKKR